MRSTGMFLPILLIGFGARAAFAQGLNEWRTQVQVTVRSGNNTQFAFDGAKNVASASQMLSTPGDGAKSEAQASLSKTGFVPTLRVRATADPTRAQAVAWGVQGYTNTSGAPLDTGLVLTLTADITGGNDIDARIYLFQDEDFDFASDSGTILFESSSRLWPGFEPFANNLGPTGFDIDIKNHDGPIAETRQFDFTVAPGDSFYVWARLVATADTPGVVDAFSTLTASFTNTAGLTPAAVDDPIPVPVVAPWGAVGLTCMLLLLGVWALRPRREVVRA